MPFDSPGKTPGDAALTMQQYHKKLSCQEGRCPEDSSFFLWNRRIAPGDGKCYNRTRCVRAHKNKKEETAALWNNFI